MKFYILLFLTLASTICKAQPKVKIYYEQSEDGFNIYADNQEYCHVSVKMDFELTNLEMTDEDSTIYSINPLSKKQLLVKLIVSKKGKSYKFSYKTLANLGNHNLENYDSEYMYDLPFSTNNSFKVDQGYNGNFSHQNENALDFKMPIGTEIAAIREGVVIKVVENNTINCNSAECGKYNNLIIIYHPDGTFAEYTHIKLNGSIVNVGDEVTKGQIIGYSGNVGWSSGPHLHLVVFLQKLDTRITLETKFKIGSGEKSAYLVEKTTYTKGY